MQTFFDVLIPSIVSSMLGRLNADILFVVGMLALGILAFYQFFLKKVI